MNSQPTGGPLAWARVLGRSPLTVDYGDAVAVNAAGRVLVAGRWHPPEGGHVDDDVAELVQLDTHGAPRWHRALVGAAHLRAPSVALDDQGAAYVAGPYVPIKGNTLDGSARVWLTKLDTEGHTVWSQSLARMAVVDGLPLQPPIGVAAEPNGDACAVWTEGQAIQLARFDPAGKRRWHRTFSYVGDIDPRIGVALDVSGAVTLWGAFGKVVWFDTERPLCAQEWWERFLARIQIDGRVRWSTVLRTALQPFALPSAMRLTDYSVAPHRDGSVSLAAVARLRDKSAQYLYIAHVDAAGSTTERGRFEGTRNAWHELTAASTGKGAVALAGSFTGRFTIARQTVESAPAPRPSIFVARIGESGSWVRMLDAPEQIEAPAQLEATEHQRWLSVHGDASGAVVLSGWCKGPMDLGGERIPEGDGAAFFVARYT